MMPMGLSKQFCSMQAKSAGKMAVETWHHAGGSGLKGTQGKKS